MRNDPEAVGQCARAQSVVTAHFALKLSDVVARAKRPAIFNTRQCLCSTASRDDVAGMNLAGPFRVFYQPRPSEELSS